MSTARIQSALDAGMIRGVVLAAGSGRRLGAITDPTTNRHARQKGICPLGSYEVIDSSLVPLLKLGLDKVHVVTGFLSSDVRTVLGSKYGQNLSFTEANPPYVNTAGNVLRVLKKNDPKMTGGIVIVKSCDITSNISTEDPLDSHLECGNKGATLVVSPTDWASLHNYGTIKTEGMPKRKDPPPGSDIGMIREAQERFEEALDIYYRRNAGRSLRIFGFREKAGQEKAFSNLTNSSDYYISVELLRAFGPHLTETDPIRGGTSFSDFGSHIWPSLTIANSRTIRFNLLNLYKRLRYTYEDNIDDGLIERIRRGDFPLRAYFMPPYSDERGHSFLLDVGRPKDYHTANMAILDGRFVNRLFPENITRHKTMGNTTIINSIVDPQVVVQNGATIINSVIRSGLPEEGSHTTIGPKARIYNSVVFPSLWPGERVTIGTDSLTTVANSLVTGGVANGEFIADKDNVKIVYAPTVGNGIRVVTISADK